VSFTGPGRATWRVSAPKGVGIFTREALLPYEVQAGVARYTGSKPINKKLEHKKAARRKRMNKKSRDSEEF